MVGSGDRAGTWAFALALGCTLAGTQAAAGCTGNEDDPSSRELGAAQGGSEGDAAVDGAAASSSGGSGLGQGASANGSGGSSGTQTSSIDDCRVSVWASPDAPKRDYSCTRSGSSWSCDCGGAPSRATDDTCTGALEKACAVTAADETFCELDGADAVCWPVDDPGAWVCRCNATAPLVNGDGEPTCLEALGAQCNLGESGCQAMCAALQQCAAEELSNECLDKCRQSVWVPANNEHCLALRLGWIDELGCEMLLSTYESFDLADTCVD
jgi:hypothetical protein